MNDYLKLISERSGIQFDFVSVSPLEWSLKIENGEFDLFPTFNETRLKAFANFTNPIMDYTTVIISRNDIPFINGINSLKGKKVAVVKGISAYRLLFKQHPEIKFIEKNDVLSSLDAVSETEADAQRS